MSTVSSKIYLSSFSGPVFDQVEEGSCVANAICQAVRLQSREYHKDTGELARNQIYYDYRAAYRDVRIDGGADITDTLTVAKNVGIATQASAAPYDGTVIDNNTGGIIFDTTSAVYQAPTASARASASSEKLTGYTDYVDYLVYKDGIQSHGFLPYDPATLGVSVTATQANINPLIDQQLMHGKAVLIGGYIPQWMSDVAGLPLAQQNSHHNDDSTMGEHAFIIVGRDDTLGGGSYIVENSWGTGAGYKGYLTLPYNFLSDGIKVREIAVVEGFKNVDTEWTATRANVAELYVGLLGRAVEHAGLEFWNGYELRGMSEQVMAGEILKSGEATLKLGSLTNFSFVNKIYENATGHSAASTVADAWASQLNQGASRSDVAFRMLDSLLNSSGADHDTFVNRVTVAETFGLTYQIDSTQVSAEKAIASVTSNADTVQIALTGIQHDLGWLSSGLSTYAFGG